MTVMGMYDSFIAKGGSDWQTKAYHCVLAVWQIGDVMPEEDSRGWRFPEDYQVRVMGDGPERASFVHSWATVRGGRVVEVPAERDERLQELDYFGHPVGVKQGQS